MFTLLQESRCPTTQLVSRLTSTKSIPHSIPITMWTRCWTSLPFITSPTRRTRRVAFTPKRYPHNSCPTTCSACPLRCQSHALDSATTLCTRWIGSSPIITRISCRAHGTRMVAISRRWRCRTRCMAIWWRLCEKW